MMRRRPGPIAAIAALVALLVTTTLVVWHVRPEAPQPPAAAISSTAIALSGPSMGSTWMVRLPRLPAGRSAGEIQSAVQEVLDGIERQMSTYRPDSDLSRFNASRSTDWVAVPRDVANVVNAARQVADQTGGAFDVTVGPLVNLWGFGPDHPAGPFGTLPSDAMIVEARRHVGYRMLEVGLSPAALRKADPAIYADLSGIAKGFAAERVGHRLDELGATDYLIAVGGEMRARGLSQRNRPWRVGIETPTPGTRRVLYEVELQDMSLSTSGDYRNFFDKDGRRYCHEIDPATGRPVVDPPASVSVVHQSGTYADAMATALMVLGTERGYELAKNLHLAVLFIVREKSQFRKVATAEFERLLVSESAR